MVTKFSNDYYKSNQFYIYIIPLYICIVTLNLLKMRIKDLENYVLFVFDDKTNDRIASTTDIEVLKEFTPSESFKIGDKIKLFDEEMIIKDIDISKVTEDTFDNFKFGWSSEGIDPQGIKKDALFRVTITF